MSPRLKFAILAALMGAASFFVASLFLTAVFLAVTGSGPHGYGVFLYLVAPIYYTPAGVVAGLVLSLLVKRRTYARVLAGLGVAFAGYTLLLALILVVMRVR